MIYKHDRIGIHNAYSPGSKVGLNPDETTIAELVCQIRL